MGVMYSTRFKLAFGEESTPSSMDSAEMEGFKKYYTDDNVLIGKLEPYDVYFGYFSSEAAASDGSLANTHTITITCSGTQKLTSFYIYLPTATEWESVWNDPEYPWIYELAPVTELTVAITSESGTETVTPEISGNMIMITGTWTAVSQILITITKATANKHFAIEKVAAIFEDARFSLTDNVKTAKIVKQKGFLGETAPVSTLTVTISDPEGLYSITNRDDLADIFEAGTEAEASETVTQYASDAVTSGGATSWGQTAEEEVDLGTWYLKEAESSQGILTLTFTDSLGIDDQTPGQTATSIDFSKKAGAAYTTVQTFAPFTVGPFTDEQTTRQQEEIKRLYQGNTDISEVESSRQKLQDTPTAGMVTGARLKPMAPVTKVTANGKRRYIQCPVGTSADITSIIATGNPNTYWGNAAEMTYIGSLKPTAKSISCLTNPSGGTSYVYVIHVGVGNGGPYLPGAFYVEGWKNGAVDSRIAVDLDYNSRTDTNSVYIDLGWSDSPGEEATMAAKYDTIYIWGVKAAKHVSGYFEAGTHTVRTPGWVITSQTNLIVTKGAATITASTPDTITFTTTAAGDVEIIGLYVFEEDISQEAVSATAADEEPNTRSFTIDAPVPDGWASTRLSLLNTYSIEAELEMTPYIRYGTSEGDYDNLTIEPGDVLYYTPEDDSTNRYDFIIYVTEVETDLTGGYIRRIKGRARKE